MVKTNGRYFLSKVTRVHDEMWALGQATLLKHTGPALEWKRIESLMLDKSSAASPPAAATPTKGSSR